MTDLGYPIGKFNLAGPLTEEQKQTALDDIAGTPAKLRAAQLNTPYRPGGWTVRQVVHHMPESHLNSYVRFKLALTEDEPTIKPYVEDRARGTGGYQVDPDRRFVDAARFLARTLGAAVALAHARGMEAHIPPSGTGCHDPGEDACPVRVAWTPSRGARDCTSQTDVVVTSEGTAV